MAMFVRKRIGWGISPGDWRGWLLTIAYAALVGALLHFCGTAVGGVGAALLSIAFLAFAIWAFSRKI